MNPKISVIIPVYNVEKYLRKCLDSVICQTMKEIEIICIDYGSTDKSLQILTEYAEIFWHYARKTPFYEEIIYENTKLSGKASSSDVKYSIRRKKIYLNYLRCKLLSIITFGKKREHYKNKRNILHERVRIARRFLK